MSGGGNFLIVRLGAAGDVLLTTGLARALRQARPRATIGWITSDYAAGLLRSNPDLDAVLPLAAARTGVRGRAIFGLAWMRTLWQWRRRHGPATVLLAHRSRLLARSARASGQTRVLAWEDPVPYRRDRHRLEVLAGLLTAAGIAVPAGGLRPRLALEESERVQGEAVWANSGGAPRWVLAPGGADNPWSAMPNRRWPRQRFAELARRAVAAGVELAWVGGAGDAALTAAIRQSLPAPGGRDCTGRLPLRVSAGVIGAADLLIGNDSLPLVMAQALGRPALGLYGPTAGIRIHAAGQPFLQGSVGCGPCYDERAAQRGVAYLCPRARCMEEIAVEEVWRRASLFLPRKERACAV